MVVKRVPLRTCVQCQQVRPKRELIRLVRTPNGEIQIDERGKVAGRGAYLCRNQACWENAIARDRLDYALKTKLSPEDKERLLQYGQQLPGVTVQHVAEAQLLCPEAREPSLTQSKGSSEKGERNGRHA